MLSNRGGFSSTRSLPPASKVSLYKVGDTLVSNIRPYFKKIWLSDRNGGCSNDILIFRPNANCDSEYLYWLLSSDTFFNYMMATSKGTKMPRGDKLAIMHYKVPNYSVEVQKRIVCILHPIQKKIALNRNINGYLAELCETIASKYCETGDARLEDICYLVTERFDYTGADLDTYVSTESLLQNKQGRQPAASLPTTGKVTRYKTGDTLVSNIRPYFKKVWYAPFDGTCSGDVLVFRAKDSFLSPYLYACLRQDRFFDHVMRGSKGTKMPRGDKKQLMDFRVSITCENKDVGLLIAAVQVIAANAAESEGLVKLRDALLPKLMSGEIYTAT